MIVLPINEIIDSKGRKLRRALRISALKWLKPGPADNIRDIQANGRDNDKQLISQSGIRLARNQRKRALPAQHGHIMFDDSATASLPPPALLPPLTDQPPVLPPRVHHVDAPSVVPSSSASTSTPSVSSPTATVTPSSSNDDISSTEAAPSTPSPSPSPTSTSSSSSDVSSQHRAHQPTVIGINGGARPLGRGARAKGRVKIKRAEVDEEKAARDAERKNKRDAESNQGVDLDDLKRAARSGVVIDDIDDEEEHTTASSTSSAARETKEATPSTSTKASFTGQPEELPSREPTEQIGNEDYKEPKKEPAYGRGCMCFDT
jgi:hypothetical protein